MPLQSYTPVVKSPAYDLIDQAFNRFVASQSRPLDSANAAGGGSLQGPGAGGPSIQGPASGPAQQQIPDLFNRQQPGPAYQSPDQQFNPAPQGGGQTPSGGQQQGGGDPNQSLYTILAALLGGGQQGQNDMGQKPTFGLNPLERRQEAFSQQNPWFQFQGQAAGQPPEVAGLWNMGNYGYSGRPGGPPQLNDNARQQALSFLLQHLAAGGMQQNGLTRA